jgi:hypothetical protein
MTGLMSRSYQYQAYTTAHQEVLEIKQTFEDRTETDKTLHKMSGPKVNMMELPALFM